MADTKVWSSTDGNWGAAGSWIPSGVPVSTDHAVFPSGNYQAVTSGLDQSAVDLGSLFIEAGNFSEIGTTDDPLQIAANLIHHKGIATLWLQPVANVDQLLVDAQNWEDAIHLKNVPNFAISTMTVVRGKVVASGTDGIITNIEVSYRTHPNDAIVDLSGFTHSGIGQFTNLVMNTGRYNGVVDDGAIRVDGGLCTILDDSSGVGGPSIIQTGGFIDWQSTTELANAFILGGTFSSQSDLRQKTIAKLLIFPGATGLLPSNVTITAGGTLVTRPT